MAKSDYQQLMEQVDFYKSVIIELEKRVYNAEMERDQLKNWLRRLEEIAAKNAGDTQVTKFFKDMGIKY